MLPVSKELTFVRDPLTSISKVFTSEFRENIKDMFHVTTCLVMYVADSNIKLHCIVLHVSRDD